MEYATYYSYEENTLCLLTACTPTITHTCLLLPAKNIDLFVGFYIKIVQSYFNLA